ncbi:MAG: nickel-responsive transcriptional regulator NikR [Thermoplasmatales archaeon]|jgi:CopG family nickel-responsive transcriptional regulator|nr:nickel-responsive transcriptional regulator NikR [Thermoplasmatales archaeon]
MDGVTRIGVSLDPRLLNEFDLSITQKGYVSRSEAIRDLIRDSLAEKEWKNERQITVGVLVFVYDSRHDGIHDQLRDLGRKWRSDMVGSLSVPLEGRNILETVTAIGVMGDLKNLSNELMSIKGVLRGKLTMTSPASGNMHHAGLRGD